MTPGVELCRVMAGLPSLLAKVIAPVQSSESDIMPRWYVTAVRWVRPIDVMLFVPLDGYGLTEAWMARPRPAFRNANGTQ